MFACVELAAHWLCGDDGDGDGDGGVGTSFMLSFLSINGMALLIIAASHISNIRLDKYCHGKCDVFYELFFYRLPGVCCFHCALNVVTLR